MLKKKLKKLPEETPVLDIDESQSDDDDNKENEKLSPTAKSSAR